MQDKDRVITGTFQVQMQLTNNRMITFTAHVFNDDTPRDVHTRVDAAQDVIDRQFIRCDIVTKKAQREAHMMNLEMCKKQLADMADRQRRRNETGILKLSGQEINHLKNGDQTIKTIVSEIEKVDAAIKAAENKLKLPEPAAP